MVINIMGFYQLYKRFSRESRMISILEHSNMFKGSTITELYNNVILEAKATKKNIEKFNQQYGVDFSDDRVASIFQRLENRKATLNPDPFSYGSIGELLKAITTPSPKEEKNMTNQGGFYKTDNSKGANLLRKLLRIRYGDILDEDIDYLIRQYNDYKSKGGTTPIMGFRDLSSMKEELSRSDKDDMENRIDEDPEISEDSRIIYSDDELMLVRVGNYEDSHHLCHNVGHTGAWCISYPHSTKYWNDYTSEGKKFIFLLLRDGDKYAITYIDGAHEIYNRADNLASGFQLAKKYPQIIDPLKEEGVTSIKHADEYDAKKTDYGWEVEEVFTKALGGLTGKFTSYLNEDYDYLDMIKDKHPAIKVER